MAFTVNDPGWTGSVARFWQRSYAADYLGFILLQVAFLLNEFLIDPFHRMFSLDDLSKSYPHAEIQRVSALQNLLYAGLGPLVFFILWAVVFRPRFHKIHVTLLGFFISLTLTAFITDIVKNTVGRPRPDLIARCKPRPDTPSHILVTIDVCTETDHHTLHDGWRSFPSGHSSFSFSGLGYLALFLAGQLHTFRLHADLARVLLTLTPTLGALMIAVSRLADYRHDVSDVTCGSILGMSVAYFSYRRYFRPLSHPRCDEPYSSKAEHLKRLVRRNDVEDNRLRQHAEEFELYDIGSEEEESLPLNKNTESSPERGKGKQRRNENG